MPPVTPELLLYAYRSGVFPMADPEHGNEVHWYAPDPRAILPLAGFHLSRSLARTVRQGRYRVTMDVCFNRVMEVCAEPREEPQNSTWISAELIAAYTALHELGCAHSVECWDADMLVGGLYGVAIGAAFFGESMFHRARDASKVALVHLVRHLQARGFVLLDVQFQTSHLAKFGVIEIPRGVYEARLARAIAHPDRW